MFIPYIKKTHAYSFILIQAITFFLSPGLLQAASVDSGQELRQQQQQELRRSLPTQIPEQEPPLEQENKTSKNETIVYVKEFIFSGVITIFSKQELYALVAEYTEQNVTITDLNTIVSKVTQHYREQGYLTSRAFLPPQDVTEGTINIEIQEGRFDGTDGVEINSKEIRLNQSFAEAIFTHALKPDSVIQQENIERGTLLLRDLPGITASANLEAGSTPNTSKVVLDLTEGPIFNPGFSLRNSGSRLTGEYQAALSLDINNLSGFADQTSITYQETFGAGAHHYLFTRAQIPVGYSGFKLGGTAQYLEYKIGKEFAALNSKGDALQLGFDVDYPLIRSSKSNLYLSSGFEYKRLRDETLGIPINHRVVKEIFLGVAVNKVDHFWGGGYTLANLKYYRGDLDLSELDIAFQLDQSSNGADTDGSYNKLSFNARRIQRATSRLNFILDLRSQWASKNLSSSEKMQLGGSTGVRAYPSGEGSGDSGVLINLEGNYVLLNATAVGDISLKGFYDWGHISQFKDPDQLILDTPNSYSLSGIGFAISAYKAGKFDANLTIAHRLGSNPGRNSVSGKDSDGSLDKTRLWFSTNLQF